MTDEKREYWAGWAWSVDGEPAGPHNKKPTIGFHTVEARDAGMAALAASPEPADLLMAVSDALLCLDEPRELSDGDRDELLSAILSSLGGPGE